MMRLALVLAPNALSAALGLVMSTTKPACAPPPSQPPGWVFAVVWPVLYLLVGLALAELHDIGAFFAFATLAALVLGLNAWWLAFAPRCLPNAAFGSIVALAVWTFATIYIASMQSGVAAALLAPLAMWLCFASFLSYQIVTSN
jgi:tryptophan-rich sensory protein